jgi:multidrug efflux pump subunit AcrA (membrane-fusion protein)
MEVDAAECPPMKAAQKKAAAGAALVVVAGAALALWLAGRGGPPAAAAGSTTVERGTVTTAISAAGTIQAAQTRGLGFSSAGTVTELNVRAGDLVTAGQVLARIDPADAQAAVDSASARVADATDALTRAQATAALPPCPTTTATAPAPSSSASAGASPGASPGAGPGAGAGGGGAGGGGGTGGGSRGTTTTAPCNSRVSTSDALLAAEQQLNNAKLSLTQANTRLAGTTITAPAAGRVLSVGGVVGSRVSPGGSGFVVLGDVSSLTVRAEFTEADVGRLAVGQVAAITLPDRLEPVNGKVSQIDPAGTITNRLVRYAVLIAFDAVPDNVLLGQSATVLVTTASVDDVLYLSSSALVPTGDGVGTVTVQRDGRPQSRTVKFGLRGDQYTEITDGLSEGETVLLPGIS